MWLLLFTALEQNPDRKRVGRGRAGFGGAGRTSGSYISVLVPISAVRLCPFPRSAYSLEANS